MRPFKKGRTTAPRNSFSGVPVLSEFRFAGLHPVPKASCPHIRIPLALADETEASELSPIIKDCPRRFRCGLSAALLNTAYPVLLDISRASEAIKSASWFDTTPTDGDLDRYNSLVVFPILPPRPLGRRFLAKIDVRESPWSPKTATSL
jgi:hypothetical protein